MPFGYEVKDKKLLPHRQEKHVIQNLYHSYLKFKSLNALQDDATQKNYVTRDKKRSDGVIVKGHPFRINHLNSILRNPIYAGKITHKGNIYGGQHQAIIDETTWHQVQILLQKNAVRARNRRNGSTHVAFKGKLFDEYDRPLLPSFNRKKNNERRYYYYVSSELVHKSSARCENPHLSHSKWCLPAISFEATVTGIIQNWWQQLLPDDILSDETSSDMIQQFYKHQLTEWLKLVERIIIYADSLTIMIDARAIAQTIDISPRYINQDVLTIKAPFIFKKRGVESKLILNSGQTTLISHQRLAYPQPAA